MELIEGYKNTEVGVIPKDWRDLTFKDISWVNQGLQIPISQRLTLPNRNSKVYITIQYLNDGKSIEYIDDYVDSVCCSKDDVLMTRTGNTGIVVTGVEGVFHNNFFKINFNREKIDKDFLVYYLNQSKTKKIILAKAGTSTIPDLNHRDFYSIPVPLPPTISEQTAIATALSDADALINSLEKLIAKKRNIKQGAMQQLLKPKRDWEHKSLGEIGLISGAGVDKLINEDEVPVRLVNYMDVFNRDFIYSKELYHWVTAPQQKAIKCAIKQGDIFFTPSSEMRYDIAVSAVAMEDIPNAVYSYHLVRLRLSEDWDLNFRSYIFKTRYFLGQAEQVCEGSGKRYVITLPKFRSLKVYYPKTKEEQTRIATILSDMDAEIQALETKLEKYRKIKLGMMQNLLTGKIRLV